jgi:hypothetical protein
MVNLFTSYFKSDNENRQDELDFCLNKNIENEFIDKIYLLSETEDVEFNNSKVEVIPHNRPSFKDFFEIINQKTSTTDINILSNSDIFFDNSLKFTEKILKTNVLLSLLRWEFGVVPKIEIMRSDCQDTWIWIGKMKELNYSDFYLGKLGCDNRIAWEFQNVGYHLLNPCTIIKTYHYHTSNIRTYEQTIVGQQSHDKNKDVIKPPYQYVRPY